MIVLELSLSVEPHPGRHCIPDGGPISALALRGAKDALSPPPPANCATLISACDLQQREGEQRQRLLLTRFRVQGSVNPATALSQHRSNSGVEDGRLVS